MIRKIGLGISLIFLLGFVIGAKGEFFASEERQWFSVLKTFENFKKIETALLNSDQKVGYVRPYEAKYTWYWSKLDMIMPDGINFVKTVFDDEVVKQGNMIAYDGEYIYKAFILGDTRKIVIIKAYPPRQMEKTTEIILNKNFMPCQIYVNGTCLAVVGLYQKVSSLKENIYFDKLRTLSIDSVLTKTACYIYDISNRKKPTLVRTFYQDGRLFDSRLVRDTLYLASVRWSEGWELLKGEGSWKNDPNFYKPCYYDSAVKGGEKQIDFSEIYYVPNFVFDEYTIVSSLKLGTLKPAKIIAILGGMEDMFVSQKNLYIAIPCRAKVNTSNKAKNDGKELKGQSLISTTVSKFKLTDGGFAPESYATVKGKIVYQGAMDEIGSYFRIVTSSCSSTQKLLKGEVDSNNVYILDNNMKIVGKLENFAPNKKIYSAKSLGKRVYLGTYPNPPQNLFTSEIPKRKGPFIVVDISSPQKPNLLGYLNMPSYATSLYSYNEKYALVTSYEPIEKYKKMGYYNSIKIAMYDLSDVKRPKELFSTLIGSDAGAYWDDNKDQRAFLLDKKRGIVALAVIVYKEAKLPFMCFRGAYVYKIDFKKGFELKSKISHPLEDRDIDFKLPEHVEEKYKKAAKSDGIMGFLVIKDALYTISNSYIKASRLDNMQEIKYIRASGKSF
ncbi:beta-propeller domain-containing protein [Caldicellulosiruptor acetigenus]|uniref:beta-propeller domain-containing protein n=1 Tax=Caldicellulosiruptor acetigenus TaxID=301953 RepID=UPI000414C335|nr:beta-propeller domain-containing protein [Caldicellulosiruptor acetigenus]WAM36206.1 beta-propeller domain-containing protein [Caldicellulosiruptor acetigenus]